MDGAIRSGNRVSTEILTTLNVAEESTNHDFSIYPNPCSELLNIRGNLKEFDRFEIVDMRGKQLLKDSMNSEQSISVNVDSLQVGSYIFKLNGPTGSVLLKFIKK